jgi:WD40 repeat protein
VVFSPDGTRLASGSFNGTVKIWDATTSPEARTFHGPTGWRGNCVAFSPDGKRLAFGGGTWDDTKNVYVAGEVKVWEAQTGKQLLTCKGHTGVVYSVAFSPDGKRLAGGSGTWEPTKKAFVDREVKVWDAQTGQELLTCKGHTAAVASVVFSPDGKRLASSSSVPGGYSPFGDPGEPGEVLVWDTETGQELLSLKGHSRFVNSVAFSPDGKRLATLSRDNTIKVWDAQTRQAILTLKPVPADIGGHVVFSPDGKHLAAGSKVWDAQTGQELLTLQGGGGLMAFSPDGKRLAGSAGSGPGRPRELKVWDAQTGQELLSLKGSGRGAVAFSPDGHRLASSGVGTPIIWDATPLPEKP